MQTKKFELNKNSVGSRYIELYCKSISGQIMDRDDEELTYLERDVLNIDSIMELRSKAEHSQSKSETEDVSGFGITSFMDVLFGTSVSDEEAGAVQKGPQQTDLGKYVKFQCERR